MWLGESTERAIGEYFRFAEKEQWSERLSPGKICMGPSIMLVQSVYKPTALSNEMNGYLQMRPSERSCRKWKFRLRARGGRTEGGAELGRNWQCRDEMEQLR